MTAASAYSEALVAFARAGRVDDAHTAIASMGIAVLPLTAAISERAADLRAAHLDAVCRMRSSSPPPSTTTATYSPTTSV
jgi:hypothetical protein